MTQWRASFISIYCPVGGAGLQRYIPILSLSPLFDSLAIFIDYIASHTGVQLMNFGLYNLLVNYTNLNNENNNFGMHPLLSRK